MKKINWKQTFLNKNNLLVMILLGVLLMVIALPVDKLGKKEKNTDTGEKLFSTEVSTMTSPAEMVSSDVEQSEEVQNLSYVEEMEEKVSDILSKTEGAGRVEVVITLRTSTEKVIEKDFPTMRSQTEEQDQNGGSRIISSTDSKEQTIYSTQGNNAEPYVIKTLSPEVEGVLILAEGAGDGTVSQNLSEAAQVLFGIEAHKVKVIKMKQG